MDKAFIDEMKASLSEELKTLDGELKAISHPDKGDHVPGERDADFPNYGDDNIGENSESPTEVADYEVNVSVTGRLEQRHKEVTEALARVDNGTFGKCEKCAGDIGEDRLRANSAANTCISCAKTHQ